MVQAIQILLLVFTVEHLLYLLQPKVFMHLRILYLKWADKVEMKKWVY